MPSGLTEGSCSNKKLDRDDDSKKSHPDLGGFPDLSKTSPTLRDHALW